MTVTQWAVLVFGVLALGGSCWVLHHHNKYWMTEAIIIFTLPLIVTAAMFIAVSQPSADGFRDFFAVLTAVLTFIGGYAAAEKKNKTREE
jgi:predicted MFS family arabinose efflux permease